MGQVKITLEGFDDLEELKNNLDRSTTKASRVTMQITSLINPIEKRLGKLAKVSMRNGKLTLKLED